MGGGTPELEAQVHGPALCVRKRVAALRGNFRRPDIRVMVQQPRKKNRHEAKAGALPHGPELMRGKPRIGTDVIEIKFHPFHGRRSRCTVTASRPSEAPRSVAKRRTRNLEPQASGVMDAGSRNDGCACSL